MGAARSAVSAAVRKLMGLGASLLGRGFRSSKCKTEVKLATARIKLLRNRREAQIRIMRRDVAMLIQSGQESTARIRIEHVIREENILAANEIIELFCELVVARLSIISKQRDCPADLKEGISSLIFAAPRCSEIPELLRIRDIFEKKYGKDFIAAATDLRPNSGVNRLLIEKLSVRTPSGEMKLKIMKEIAKEHQIEWDAMETEQELLKAPEERLKGPTSFTSSSTFPINCNAPYPDVPNHGPGRLSNTTKDGAMNISDTATTAQAAAELAEKAAAVAQAAAHLAKQTSHQVDPRWSYNDLAKGSGRCYNGEDVISRTSSTLFNHSITDKRQNATKYNRDIPYSDEDVFSRTPSTQFNYSSVDEQQNTKNISGEMSDDEARPAHLNGKRISRRHGYRAREGNSDVNFDDSDGVESGDDDYESERNEYSKEYRCPPPPNRPPPGLNSSSCDSEEKRESDGIGMHKPALSSRVHPKLPDYEDLASRFEALKMRRMS